MKQEYIYRLAIRSELSGDNVLQKEYFFTSLSAIFDKFTPDIIGCKVERLWSFKITPDNPYLGRRCVITKEPLFRKRQLDK